MKFEDWIKVNKNRKYADILQEVFKFEDPQFFKDWANDQRLGAFTGNDWAMLSISLLDSRIKELEKKDKK